MKSQLLPLAALCAALAGSASAPALAQIAGTTAVAVTGTEVSRAAMGWSVRKSILGKSLYNDAGDKVGKVEDLIIAPEKNVTYLIVGAGGFVGIGKHTVAVPASQIQQRGGRLVMAGATKDVIKAMPQFEYADRTAGRTRFVDEAEKDILRGRAKAVELQKMATGATTDAKGRLDLQAAELDLDLKTAEARLTEMRRASATSWKEFESDVSAALARLRKSIEKATG